MSLLNLSEEILLNIISHLQSHTDVVHLAVQCRRLHKLFDVYNQRKYRRVKLRGTKELTVAFDMLCSILKSPRLGTYVRHIELNRSPTLRHGIAYSYTPRPAQRSLQPSIREKLEQAIRRAGFDSTEAENVLNILLQDPRTWKNGRSSYRDSRAPFFAQALASLLVSVSPNLERLTLCPVGHELTRQLVANEKAAGRNIETPDYFFKHFMDRANTRKDMPFLQNLRTVRFILDSGGYAQYYADSDYQEYDLYGGLNLVRRLPAIRSVRVDAITDPEDSSVQPPPRSGNYSRIVVRNSSLDFNYLVGAIESAKRLEEFAFSIGGRASIDGSFRLFYPDKVFRSLFSHRDTLERLDLDVDAEIPLRELFDPNLGMYFFADRGPDRDEEQYQYEWAEELREMEQTSTAEAAAPPPPCSLRSLVRLKHLSLGIHLLYYFARGIGDDQLPDGSFSLVDRLPPNLESLRIYGYKKGMKPPIEELPESLFDTEVAKLMAEKDRKLPLLTHIEGIDTMIKNAKTIENPDQQKDELWGRESDCEWTDYEY